MQPTGRMDAEFRCGHSTPAGTLTRVPFAGRLWIVETGVSHRLADGEYNQRRRECEEALAFCREWRPGLTQLAQLAPGDLEEVERGLAPIGGERV